MTSDKSCPYGCDEALIYSDPASEAQKGYDAAISALEQPTPEMCRAAIIAWDNKAVESDEAGMAAALAAAAAHLKGEG